MLMIKKIKGESKRKSLVPFLSITGLLLIILILSWYWFDVIQSQKKLGLDKSIKSNLSEAADNVSDNKLPAEKKNVADLTVDDVVGLASRHMLLTEGEITVVTITDIENLRQESQESAVLFQYAKNGDKLLFYDNGIIIYDPRLDKIVDVLRRFPNGINIPRKP